MKLVHLTTYYIEDIVGVDEQKTELAILKGRGKNVRR